MKDFIEFIKQHLIPLKETPAMAQSVEITPEDYEGVVKKRSPKTSGKAKSSSTVEPDVVPVIGPDNLDTPKQPVASVPPEDKQPEESPSEDEPIPEVFDSLVAMVSFYLKHNYTSFKYAVSVTSPVTINSEAFTEGFTWKVAAETPDEVSVDLDDLIYGTLPAVTELDDDNKAFKVDLAGLYKESKYLFPMSWTWKRGKKDFLSLLIYFTPTESCVKLKAIESPEVVASALRAYRDGKIEALKKIPHNVISVKKPQLKADDSSEQEAEMEPEMKSDQGTIPGSGVLTIPVVGTPFLKTDSKDKPLGQVKVTIKREDIPVVPKDALLPADIAREVKPSKNPEEYEAKKFHLLSDDSKAWIGFYADLYHQTDTIPSFYSDIMKSIYSKEIDSASGPSSFDTIIIDCPIFNEKNAERAWRMLNNSEVVKLEAKRYYFDPCQYVVHGQRRTNPGTSLSVGPEQLEKAYEAAVAMLSRSMTEAVVYSKDEVSFLTALIAESLVTTDTNNITKSNTAIHITPRGGKPQYVNGLGTYCIGISYQINGGKNGRNVFALFICDKKNY